MSSLKMSLSALLLLLFSWTFLSADPAPFGQYQAMLTMKGFFEDKILNNQLLNSIDFQDKTSATAPTFEAYHESNTWEVDSDSNVWLGNLHTGARFHFSPAKVFDQPLNVDAFCLMDFSFISTPSGYYPVIDVPFPYIMSIGESAKEFMPGASVALGNSFSPLVKLSYGHSFYVGDNDSQYFDTIDPINVFDIRSPQYCLFFQAVQNGSTLDFSSNTTYNYGFIMTKSSDTSDWLGKQLSFAKNLCDVLILEEQKDNYQADDLGGTHLGVSNLYGIGDVDFAIRTGDGRGIRTSWWRLGGHYDFQSDKVYSSIYKAKCSLKAGVTYKNVNDYKGFFLLPFNNKNYTGTGCYAEVTFQNPFLQSVDYFYLFLNFNLLVAEALSNADTTQTQNTIQQSISDIQSKEESGAYNGDLFDRITIGYEINNPQQLDIHPFTLDENHVYCYIDVFI